MQGPIAKRMLLTCTSQRTRLQREAPARVSSPTSTTQPPVSGGTEGSERASVSHCSLIMESWSPPRNQANPAPPINANFGKWVIECNSTRYILPPLFKSSPRPTNGAIFTQGRYLLTAGVLAHPPGSLQSWEDGGGWNDDPRCTELSGAALEKAAPQYSPLPQESLNEGPLPRQEVPAAPWSDHQSTAPGNLKLHLERATRYPPGG